MEDRSRKKGRSITPHLEHDKQAAFVWCCRVTLTLLCHGTEFLCRKPESTVMIRVPFHTTPIHWHTINDSTLNTGPTGYPSSYRLQAVLGDVLHSSQEEELGYSLGWTSGPFREIDSWVKSKISVSSITSLQLLKIDRKCYGMHSCCFQVYLVNWSFAMWSFTVKSWTFFCNSIAYAGFISDI